MAALRAGGKTVVIVIAAPVKSYEAFLPIARRLVDSIRFASS
jgi:hypothetical protein